MTFETRQTASFFKQKRVCVRLQCPLSMIGAVPSSILLPWTPERSANLMLPPLSSRNAFVSGPGQKLRTESPSPDAPQHNRMDA
jgi:hypothetical protein